jgi:tetratricopeptide (TPR) repeat protein
MPNRRTRDVVNVTMTDHRIATGPFDLDALVRPMEREHATISQLDILPLGETPDGNEAEIYRMIAAIRAGRSVQAAQERLGQVLAINNYPESTPYIELATAQFNAGDYEAAEATARRVIESGEALHSGYKVLGISLMAQNLRSESVAMLKRSLELQPDPEVHFNLAAAYLRYDQPELAEQQLDAAIDLRPYMAIAWKYKALILKARGDREQARDALIRSLQLEPRDLSAYQDLAALLMEMGDASEAARYLDMGTRVSQTLRRQ